MTLTNSAKLVAKGGINTVCNQPSLQFIIEFSTKFNQMKHERNNFKWLQKSEAVMRSANHMYKCVQNMRKLSCLRVKYISPFKIMTINLKLEIKIPKKLYKCAGRYASLLYQR